MAHLGTKGDIFSRSPETDENTRDFIVRYVNYIFQTIQKVYRTYNGYSLSIGHTVNQTSEFN